jgi:hypothetical protein
MRYPSKNNPDLRAPKSLFRVVVVEVDESSGPFIVGDFDTLQAATQAATARAGIGNPVYIYDDRGEVIERLGSWH